ncbi:MAG: hypothetical protein K8S94_13340 [Planctomycetia bacterium]|nr:hypothetical protein [Planctomycetia bacterium]
MSVIRVGSTTKYADGWDTVFGGRKTAVKKTAAKKAGGKKAPAKQAVAAAKKTTAGPKKSAKKSAKKAAKSRRG